MSPIDYAIVLVFIAYSVLVGFRSRKKASESLEEYFLAGRTLKGWKAGISMAATQFAADTPLLITGLIATAGVFSLWRLWIYAVSFLMMGFVLGACWRRAGVLTDAELTELRYGGPAAGALRGFKAIYFGTVFNCTVMAWVLLAATRIAEPFLLWDQWLPAGLFTPVEELVKWVGVPLTLNHDPSTLWALTARNLISILAIVGVTTLYSTTGGLRSVVDTDVVQFGIMMAGTAVFAWYVSQSAGGIAEIPTAIRRMFGSGGPGGILPDQILAVTPSRAFNASWPILAVFALQWLIQINADGTGYLAQRSMACRSDRDAKVAAVVFTVAQILVRSLLWLPIGLGLLVVFPPDLSLPGDILTGDREMTYVRGIAEILPAGVKGLMLTGMLAALASTIDTHLNWGASYWTNDIYKRFICRVWLKREPSKRSLVRVARISNVLILLVALGIMTQLTSIQKAWVVSLLLGAGVGIVLVLRWLWWRMTAWGELASLAVSLILAPILITVVSDEYEALRLLVIAVAATTAAVAVSYWRGPEDRALLKKFYLKVRPPGFWGPIARAAGETARGAHSRLGRSAAATALASLSIFSLLTGCVSLVASSPPPTWFPWRGTWIVLQFVVGLGLVPAWWRLGFGRSGPRSMSS